jgi:hypothetical protein
LEKEIILFEEAPEKGSGKASVRQSAEELVFVRVIADAEIAKELVSWLESIFRGSSTQTFWTRDWNNPRLLRAHLRVPRETVATVVLSEGETK